MRERPILFSTPMVEAILAGRKTQTRRVVKPQPLPETGALRDIPRENRWYAACVTENEWGTEYRPLGSDQQHDWRCPYGVPGDTLWVRETFANMNYDCDPHGPSWTYKAGTPSTDVEGWALPPGVKWKPGIHMPRAAARLLLRVEAVRVERLQEISQADCVAEGMPTETNGFLHHVVADYRKLWDSLNAARGYGWDANPWVWVVQFARI